MLSPSDLLRFGLTKQEKRVCCMMACGVRPAQIAVSLEVKTKTVYGYEEKIREKLGTPDRPSAIVLLRELGLHNQSNNTANNTVKLP